MKAGKREGPRRAERPTVGYPTKRRSANGPTLGSAENPVTAASILGIPEKEFTPRVSETIANLMDEIARLRDEVEQSRNRLEELARMADQDMLLPIYNRRAFVREMSRFIAMAERYGTPSSLLYLDLDDFKAVNDAFGHAAGDAVLRHFVDLVAGQIRESDVLGRLGGDEFGVILAHISRDQAARKGEALALALRDHPPRWKGRTVRLSFSYGIHEIRAGENADSAIKSADRAMYARKRRGLDPVTP